MRSAPAPFFSPLCMAPLASLLVGLVLLNTTAPAAAAGDKVWISLGDAAWAQLQQLQPAAKASASVEIKQVSAEATQGARAAIKAEKVHLVEVDEAALLGLSNAVHEKLRRCGGYMFHASKAEGMKALQSGQAGFTALLAPTRPSYVIDQQTTVNPMLAQMQASNIGQTILDLSANTNRYYTTSGGVAASNWLKNRWSNLAAGRSDITVEQFSHANWAQKSVIATIKGSDNAAQIVVLGAHLDSINSQGTTETTRAPGADDDASGVASLTEIFRTLVNSGFKPRRTLKFMAYAAEEVGLRGSQEIANSFAAANANVVGVMQLDMTNYKGAANDIYIFTDYTDSAQNTFVSNLIKTYLPTLKVGTDRCGYACSDHASWSAKGFYASMPFESSFAADNPYIHSANDTYANSGNQADHSLKFARMALAYAVELGADGAATPPVDKTENFSGSLALNQTQSFGPFKLASGGSLKASTTGSGDIDLFVKRGGPASTSSYDCKSDGSTATESCSLGATVNSDVYVLLKGYSAGTFKLTVSYTPQ
ncbi:M20/M25/M40 family metallo-hydrolase [Paucibacter sp. TC2R-5]|uniref:M20/M25/M40 family metallo-hydrolase n=1 Tax=Paucibacter sp. TC2R-5 TaxID=2893555 RepID=UPI0021E48FC6|nr:M20/M25/M40 family metallo-hydrolase [Paucibacter sp. TC2R-5]MCV2359015.1 M20/M25/M40 family metallo-hydrolase [Paucibacter sp. TC2R-5]